MEGTRYQTPSRVLFVGYLRHLGKCRNRNWTIKIKLQKGFNEFEDLTVERLDR